MTYRTLAAVLLFSSAAAAQTPPCLAMESEHITAHDFAAVLPVFAGIAADTPLGYSPTPGARRVFHAAEIAALAKRYGVDASGASDLCFEWPMEPLDKEQVLAAMKRGLNLDGVKIEIIEQSRFHVPRGTLEFDREKLGSPALASGKAPVMWRGNVVYGGNRRFAVWARVNITARVQVVVAAEDIKAGQVITPSQLRVETRDSHPLPAKLASSVEQVAGKMSRRPLAVGSQIWLHTLDALPDVDRGNLVEVEVLSGAARLGFTGKAESAGRTGDLIQVRNLSSNKIFQARVCGKNRTIVQTGGVQRN